MSIIDEHLENRIKQLMQINDDIANTDDGMKKSLEQKRSVIAGAIYELAVLKSEEVYGIQQIPSCSL